MEDVLTRRRADDEAIEAAVDALRTRLLAQAPHLLGPRGRPTDSHSIAVAKEAEMSRLQRALGVSADHQEGKAFKRETEEEKAARYAAREARDQERIAAALKREREDLERKRDWEEKEKLRRREEYYRSAERSRICCIADGVQTPGYRETEWTGPRGFSSKTTAPGLTVACTPPSRITIRLEVPSTAQTITFASSEAERRFPAAQTSGRLASPPHSRSILVFPAPWSITLPYASITPFSLSSPAADQPRTKGSGRFPLSPSTTVFLVTASPTRGRFTPSSTPGRLGRFVPSPRPPITLTPSPTEGLPLPASRAKAILHA